MLFVRFLPLSRLSVMFDKRYMIWSTSPINQK